MLMATVVTPAGSDLWPLVVAVVLLAPLTPAFLTGAPAAMAVAVVFVLVVSLELTLQSPIRVAPVFSLLQHQEDLAMLVAPGSFPLSRVAGFQELADTVVVLAVECLASLALH